MCTQRLKHAEKKRVLHDEAEQSWIAPGVMASYICLGDCPHFGEIRTTS